MEKTYFSEYTSLEIFDIWYFMNTMNIQSKTAAKLTRVTVETKQYKKIYRTKIEYKQTQVNLSGYHLNNNLTQANQEGQV